MRRNLLPFIVLFCISNCYAQETTSGKNRLTEFVNEKFNVLKTNKSIKHGFYQAYYKNKTALASGEYANGKRTGIWHFYNTKGQLVENFDYTHNTLLYEAPYDSIARKKIIYAFDATFNDTDRVTKPIKPGGEAYGYVPYLRIFQLPDSLNNIDPAYINSTIELLISPAGRLADYKVHINIGDDYNSETTFSPEVIDEDDKVFIPATLNKEPILSRIFIRCIINDYGQLDLD